MAKDLGTITHKITTGEGSGGGGGTSNTDAQSGSGRAGGTAGLLATGAIIRGVSSGGIAGGAQAISKVAGWAKLAIGIGIAVAGFALLAMGVRKVISTLFKWSKEIENGITKFSAYNGVLAVAAARMQIGKITRDIKSAKVLQNVYARTGANLEAIKDSFRPVKDAWSAIKASILNSLLPTIQGLVNVLRLVMISLIEMWISMKESGFNQAVGGYVGGVLDRMLNVVGAITGYHMPDVFEWILSRKDEEGIKIWKAMLKALEEGNQDNAIKEINEAMGAIGVQLSGGAWNPFARPGEHMIPTGLPNDPRTVP
jgi:VanZ family protein